MSQCSAPQIFAGFIATASLPVYFRGNYWGVVAVDILFNDLFVETFTFRPNGFSYAFVVNDEGTRSSD